MSDTKSGACLVIGAGADTGGAIARAFAREGYQACLARRPRNAADLEELAESIRVEGNTAHATPVDARDEDAMVALVERIETEIAPIEVAVFNIGANVNFPITETTSRVYRKVWEMAAYSGFLMGREVAKRMETRGRGTILFTGATASMRGGPGYSAFAGAKFALRALAQTMARELGPKNIHVAHVVIDGGVDTVWIRENFPDYEKRKAADGIIAPSDLADNYVMLYDQPRNAWTFEIDVRPWEEKW